VFNIPFVALDTRNNILKFQPDPFSRSREVNFQNAPEIKHCAILTKTENLIFRLNTPFLRAHYIYLCFIHFFCPKSGWKIQRPTIFLCPQTSFSTRYMRNSYLRVELTFFFFSLLFKLISFCFTTY